MARKMADEILRAEKDGEVIISEAEIRAREIIENAKIKAKSENVKQQDEAAKKADSIIEQAKADSEKGKQLAEKEANNLCGELNQLFEKNKSKALETAVSLLVS